MRRRTLLAGGAVLATPRIARAAWPDRPIRWVVPFTPGGNVDVMARLHADPLSHELGQPVVIENRGGAASNLGTEYVIRAAPDGNTILFGSIANAINQTLYRNLSFDVRRDLEPVLPLYSIPNVLTVTPSFPARSLAELIAYAKANPGAINYGSPGSGTTIHLTGAIFAQAAGIELTHVPYRGAAQAQQDLIAGRIQMIFDNLPIALPLLRDGRTRALAVTMDHRADQLPDVPTMAEAGLPLELMVWGGIFAPRGTSPEILDRLHAAFRKIGAEPSLAAKLRDMGSFPPDGDRAHFAAFFNAEVERWGAVVRSSGAQVD
jgi:tripartite-type tricarboxylate transporter receptor subunit TctC